MQARRKDGIRKLVLGGVTCVRRRASVRIVDRGEEDVHVLPIPQSRSFDRWMLRGTAENTRLRN